MNIIKTYFTNINQKFFFLITSIILLFFSIYFYVIHSFSIFNLVFFVFAIEQMFRYLKKDFKLFDIFPKNKLIIIISIIFLFFMSNQYFEHDFIVRQNNSDGKDISDALFVESVEQEINLKNGKYDTVGIQFATYGRNNGKATYNISIYQNNKLIFIKDFNASEFNDTKYTNINVGKHYSNKKDKLKIVIKPIYADSENCVSIYYNKSTNNINYQIIDNSFNLIKEILIASFLVIFISINFIVNSKKIEPQKIFIIFSLYFIPLVFLIPPYDVPDEPVHFMRAYKLSLITSKDKKISDPSSVVVYGPNMKCLAYGQFQNPASHFDEAKFSDCIKEKNNILQGSGDDYAKNNISFAHPIAHIVPSVGVKLADILSDSPLKLFMAGRLMNCLVAILGTFYAINKTKKNKLIFLFVATIPMVIQQMVSYSYDALLNTSCIILSALVINKLCGEKLSKKDIIMLTISLTFILCSKSIYGLLIIPLLLSKKTKGIKDYIIDNKYIILSVIISILVLLSWKIFGQHASNRILSNPTSGSNLIYIIKNPFKIFGIAYNTFKINGWFYIQSLFGYFGWFIFRFDNITYFVYLFMTYILIKNKNTSNNILSKKEKNISVGVCILTITCVFGALYVDWSKYAMKYVDGVQGRYFIPVIPLLLISLIPKNQKDFNIKDKDIYCFINLSLLMYVITLICNIY